MSSAISCVACIRLERVLFLLQGVFSTLRCVHKPCVRPCVAYLARLLTEKLWVRCVCFCPISYHTADQGFDFVSYDCWVFLHRIGSSYRTVHFFVIKCLGRKTVTVLMSIASNVTHCHCRVCRQFSE